ncbi:MAG TPA: CoA-binding protein [Candidatus Lokiarchaeia archaeon]
MSSHFLHDFLHPKSIAFYGANNKGGGIASLQIMNLILSGFKGNIYPIHLKDPQIMGFKVYKSIAEVPEVPDLVIIVLPPQIVPKIFTECGEKGVKHLIVVSGGFREMSGDKKNTLTDEVCKIANDYGMRFIGPNCLGFYNNWIYPNDNSSAFNTSIWEILKRGSFSIASQSGTLSSHIWFDPENLDLGLSKSLSIGNEANIDIVDCLEYFKDDDTTQVIGIYIEEIKRGKRFLELAKDMTKKKPIIAIYVGGSKASKRAAMSHTGAIAGNYKIYDAAFKETGIIKTELVEEFLDLARLLSDGIYPKGKRIGIITNSGGPGAMLANRAEKEGLIVPEFSRELQEKLRKATSPTASVSNPLDSTFDMNLYNYYVNLPKILMESGEIDIIIMYGVFGFQDVLAKYIKNEQIAKFAEFDNSTSDSKQPLEKILISPIIKASKEYSIPIVYINPQNYSSPWSRKIRESGAVLFQLWDRPIRCIAKLCDYAEYRRKIS